MTSNFVKSFYRNKVQTKKNFLNVIIIIITLKKIFNKNRALLSEIYLDFGNRLLVNWVIETVTQE